MSERAAVKRVITVQAAKVCSPGTQHEGCSKRSVPVLQQYGVDSNLATVLKLGWTDQVSQSALREAAAFVLPAGRLRLPLEGTMQALAAAAVHANQELRV